MRQLNKRKQFIHQRQGLSGPAFIGSQKNYSPELGLILNITATGMKLFREKTVKDNIGKLFLNKIMGTFLKDKKGKKRAICNRCQAKLKNKDSILKKL